MGKVIEKKPLILWTIITLIVCAVLALTIDPWLTNSLKVKVSDSHAYYWRIITDLGRAGTYISFSFICFICFALIVLKKSQSEFGCSSHFCAGARNSLFVFYTLVISGISINILKFLIGRQRPKAMFEEGIYGLIPFNTNHAMNSFPSGHSQTGWALAMSLALIFPRATPLLITFATLVAISRVMLTVHFLSDVIAGALISIITAVLLKRHFLDRAKPYSITGVNVTDKIVKKYGAWLVEVVFKVPWIRRRNPENINLRSPKKKP